METTHVQKADYDQIVSVIDHWWEGPTSALAHPIFFHELGGLSRVVKFEGQMVGFLFGFLSELYAQTDSALAPPGTRIGYVHLVGIHPGFRRRGVARLLYQAFEQAALDARCQGLKALTTPGNEGSVRFHKALGWTVTEVADYAGPGRTRVVFEKAFPQK